MTVVSSYNDVVETDNGFSAILLSWISEMSMWAFPISPDNGQTSENVEQNGSFTQLCQNEESGRCPGYADISCSCFSLVVSFWSPVLGPSSIFSLRLVALFSKLEFSFSQQP